MSDKVLRLNVKGEYFDQIKSGNKPEEYRLYNEYWTKRLGKEYNKILILKGYPRNDQLDRQIMFDYQGYELKTITHKHFGGEPVLVYAIKLY